MAQKLMTFDSWNKAETKRIIERDGSAFAKQVRAARGGYFSRFIFWDDYLAACKAEKIIPEQMLA